MVYTGFHFLGFDLNRFYCINVPSYFFQGLIFRQVFCINVPSNYICWEMFWIITEFVTRLTWWVWQSLVEQEQLNLPEHLSPVLSGVRGTRSLVSCVMFCRSLFVFVFFFFWPLCCLSFFNLRVLITPLLSSNSSC